MRTASACRHVLSPSPTCIFFGLLGCTIYVISLGLLTTRRLRLAEPFNPDAFYVHQNGHTMRRNGICRTDLFHANYSKYKSNSPIHPPNCHTHGLRVDTNHIFITNGRLRIRARNVSSEATGMVKFRDVQCSLFPILRLDEYHSMYGIPVDSVRDGYQPQWPAFMVLCQPTENLALTPRFRWEVDMFKRQERHFICGAFPPLQLATKISIGEPVFNVLLLGLDSISRVSAERFLPKTMNWLRNHANTEIMDLYNIIGDGTTANLLALLTGRYEHELPESRKSHITTPVGKSPLKKTVLDAYPWLWDEFAAKGGYATHFIEDSPKWGTFQHRLMGFGTERTPTHSYGRPCLLMASQEEKQFGKILGCINTRLTHQVLLESMTEFFMAYADRPRFSLTFLSEMIHEDPAYVSLLDDDLLHVLDRIHNDDVASDSERGADRSRPFANTLVILFSDHGPRMGAARLSAQGKLEERLPLLSFILPRRLLRAWPKARVALHQNTARLTTLFDVHMTLRHLLQWQIDRHHGRDSLVHNLSTHGRSLFTELPVDRTCEEAHILPQWCTCQIWYSIVPNTDFVSGIFGSLWPVWVVKAANAVVDELNAKIHAAHRLEPGAVRCTKLKFNRIISAEQALPSRELMRFVRSMDADGRIPEYVREDNRMVLENRWMHDPYGLNTKLLRLLFLAGPGQPSHFEAVVRLLFSPDGKQEYILSTLNRLDKYEPRAWCLPSNSWPELRAFCICETDFKGFT